MCFFSRQTQKAVVLEKRFNAKVKNQAKYSTSDYYNAFEYPETPIITNTEKTVIQFYNWGLIPEFSKDLSIKKYTLNARFETLNQKPSFKNSLNNRCLIITDGFYEWKWLTETGSKKQKYLITQTNNEIFTFAGLYSNWYYSETNTIINTYTIITTEANKLMSQIHNSKKRMPLILKKEDEIKWLENTNLNHFDNYFYEDLKAESIEENNKNSENQTNLLF